MNLTSAAGRRQVILISVSIVAIGALAVIRALTNVSPPITMRVLGFTLVRSAENVPERMRIKEYVVATIEFSNATKRAITYAGRYDREHPELKYFYSTPTGWKEAPGNWCATGLGDYTPSE